MLHDGLATVQEIDDAVRYSFSGCAGRPGAYPDLFRRLW